DEYYADLNHGDEAVATQVVRQLAGPRPRDAKATSELASYKDLEARWHQWDAVISVLRDVAQAMLR
ncbi:MAG: hypothetical protein M3471_06415, partial [Actinomycetota bacterium]|nr:hypothetical protein [Actinomycetota bacterium]